jgi:flagellar biogenesis protein FliO
MAMEMIRQLGGVALTLGLLGGALWWLRRKGVTQWRPGGANHLEVIESKGLGPGHTLHLVRVADRVLALATHGSGCTLLEARPWSELPPGAQREVRS